MPAGLPGLDPRWSTLVPIIDGGGVRRIFQVLDSATTADSAVPPVGTLLCLHGNPTWSYLWRRLLADPPPGWRVVAPDHLGMGFSDRPGSRRVLAERLDDLDRLTDALDLSGPVVTVAHDWGGILSLGWALRHRDQLAGVVLTNTAVHQPAMSNGPVLIRLAHVRWINWLACRRTSLFVRTATALTRPRLPADVRAAFRRPYRNAADRAAVADFVADIPFAADHPSRHALDGVAEHIRELDVPALLLWGPRDPVFGEEHLRDLQERLPQAQLHRYQRASHLLPEDEPSYSDAIRDWVASLTTTAAAPPATAPVAGSVDGPAAFAELTAHADDPAAALVDADGSSTSWAELYRRVEATGAGLHDAGVGPGSRVALLVPPSTALTVALYSVWRAGGVIVVADKGLGLRGMGQALRGSRLDYVIADTAGLLAARAMRLPGRRIAVRDSRIGRAGQTDLSLAELAARVVPARGAGDDPVAVAESDEAAVLFTSGATGPAKGVRYLQRQLRAQLALIRDTYRLTSQDRIVAAFAPFALYGPALGIPSAVPDTDVTKPGTLTAAALADAAARIRATVVFASPAALRNVLATADGLDADGREALAGIRLLMSAGAPVPLPLLRRLQRLFPSAELHTPYGMTEALPVTDISLAEIESAGDGDGVCVGRPLPGVEVRVAPLDALGRPTGGWSPVVGASGELWVRAAHVRESYDARWVADSSAAAHPGWHRTGDVGRLDDAGRLWIQGRTVHIIATPGGPVPPVGIEQRVTAALTGTSLVDDLSAAGVAAVGVGPVGVQQVVVVVAGPGGPLAPAELATAVRAAAGQPVAAVLVRRSLPVDIRHNSKIDRVAVAEWAAEILAGG